LTILYFRIIIKSQTNERGETNLSQREFAKKIGVSLATITNWEAGKTEPDLTQLRRISELSGIPMDYIFVERES